MLKKYCLMLPCLASLFLNSFPVIADDIHDNKISISAFNVQRFGKKKCSNEKVMKNIADIAKNFDVLLLQEVQYDCAAETTCKNINKEKNYKFFKSPKLGKSSYKEEYVFLYNIDKVNITGEPYVYKDTNDMFEREPFIARFQAGKFSFVLVGIHTQPKKAEKEINSLERVIQDAEKHFFPEKDIIVLGDLNADGIYFSESQQKGIRNPEIYLWAINDQIDTTLAHSSNTYDRIIFENKFTLEDYTGHSGVFKFDKEYNLPLEDALKISDHYPVYSVFYTDRDKD